MKRRILAALCLAGATWPGSGTAKTLRELASVQIVGNASFDDQLKTARGLGVHRVRLAVYWNGVERPRGHYSWQSSDARVKAVLRAGLVPIIVLFGPNDGYPNGDGARGAPPVEGEALEGFARFAAATAARYGAGTSAMPILYELWNEPNTKTFWKRAPDPEGYARMAEATCRAIKQTTPQAKVLALAMEGTPVKTPYFVPAYNIDIYRQWAARTATPGVMGCADGISFHPYLPAPEMVLRDEPALRAFIAAVWHRPGAPLIVESEVGYAIDVKHDLDAALQAALDVRALLIGAGLGRVTNLYQSVDVGHDPTKPDQTFGLAAASGQYKPAGLAVQRLLRAIGDDEIEGIGAVEGTPGMYKFTARRGRSIDRVLWFSAKDGGQTTLTVAPGTEAVDLISGLRVPITDGHLVIGPMPILLTSP